MRKCVVVVGAITVVLVTAAPASASDKTEAKKLVVTQADVGSGYQATAGRPPDEAGFAALAKCVGTPVPKRKVVATVTGKNLTDTAGSGQVRSSVSVVKTAGMAKADKAVLAGSKFPDCLAKQARRQAGGTVTKVTPSRVKATKRGDYTTAILATVEGTQQGQPFTVTVVEVGILKGRAEIGVSFVTDGSTAFDRTKAEAILDKLDKRIDKAKV